jgi:hypothetical protein
MNIELKLAIIASEFTQRAVSKKLGWPEDVISKIIHEVRDTKPHEKEALSECLDKSVTELFPESSVTLRG